MPDASYAESIADRLSEIGVEPMLWQIEDQQHGAFIDTPDCPLVLWFDDETVSIRAEVASGGDYASDADPDLDEYVNVPDGAGKLWYDDLRERAWLQLDLRGVPTAGELRAALEQVTAVAPRVRDALRALELEFDPPATLEELEQRGPW
jgi:hypothetical protein